MPAVRVVNAEPLPGYRLLARLGNEGIGEAWTCQAPAGVLKATFFTVETTKSPPGGLYLDPRGVSHILHTFHLLKSLHHPALLRVEKIEVIDGDIVVFSEMAERSLGEHFARQRNQSQATVQRLELLEWLLEVADLLDVMTFEHRLSHLRISPHSLYLVGRQIKVGDFGQVGQFDTGTGSTTGNRSLELAEILYAAPERFVGQGTEFSDQYSLAVTYIELLTGERPYSGATERELTQQQRTAQPNLTGLPADDRSIVRRALSCDPQDRFPSCQVFVRALLNSGGKATRPLPTMAIAPSQSASNSPSSTPSELRPESSVAIEEEVEEDSSALEKTPQVAEDLTLPAGTPTRILPLESPQRPSPPPRRPVSTDPLDGWQYLDSLARMTYGEIWRVRTPLGEEKLVQLIFGYEAKPDARGRDPLQRLARLEHPTLVPVQAIPTPGRLVLVSPFPERTLLDVLMEAQENEQPGVPREELLDCLGKVADALDSLRSSHSAMHLGLNPRQFVLDEDEIRLADMGLVELILQPCGQDAASLNPRYAAPELFHGKPSQQSDQYSLALIYIELLTGLHPFRNLSQRQLASIKSRGQPDLSMVPGRDRAILSTALELEPEYRFTTCREFINELMDASAAPRPRVGLRQTVVALPPLLWRPSLDRVLRQLTEQTAGNLQVCEFGNQRYLLAPGESIQHHCHARIVNSTVPLKLDAFRERWQARMTSTDDRHFTLLIQLSATVMERLMGRQPRVEIRILLDEHTEATNTLTSVHVEVRPVSCGQSRRTTILEETGPTLVESLRNCLQADPERRRSHRFPFIQNVTLYPMLPDHEFGKGIPGQTHNVSLTGLGVYLAEQPPEDVAVHLLVPDPQGVLLAGRVVRVGRCKDGRYDVGIHFDELPTQ